MCLRGRVHRIDVAGAHSRSETRPFRRVLVRDSSTSADADTANRPLFRRAALSARLFVPGDRFRRQSNESSRCFTSKLPQICEQIFPW